MKCGKRKEREDGTEREKGNKNSETASENLMDDRSRKWENRRRLEREGDEMLEVLEKHEKQEAEERWARNTHMR